MQELQVLKKKKAEGCEPAGVHVHDLECWNGHSNFGSPDVFGKLIPSFLLKAVYHSEAINTCLLICVNLFS